MLGMVFGAVGSCKRVGPAPRPHHTNGERKWRARGYHSLGARHDATPDNGRIYVVPATREPNYSGDLKQCKANTLQDVRALPAKVGSVLGWNHQLLPWGGGARAPARSLRA
jgi:hypothetical protein